MPIHPELSLDIQPPKINTPLESLTGAVQLRDLMAQQQLRRQQILQSQAQTADLQVQAQDRQQGLADQQTFNDLVKANNGDVPKAIQAGAGKIRATYLMGLQTKWDESIKNRALTATDQINADLAARKSIGASLTGILALPEDQRPMAYLNRLNELRGDQNLSKYVANAPEQWDQKWAEGAQWQGQAANVLDEHALHAQQLLTAKAEEDKARAALPDTQAKALIAQYEVNARQVRDVTDQAGWDTFRAGLSPETQKEVPATYSDEAKQAIIHKGVPAETYEKSSIPTGELGYYLAAQANKIGKTLADLTPDEKLGFINKYKTDTADPEMRAASLAQKNIAVSLARLTLNMMPTPQDASDIASDIIHHRIAPEQLSQITSGRGNLGAGFKASIIREARKLDPNFNYEEASSEYGLVKSPGFQQKIRVMDALTSSLPQLVTNAKAVGNTSITHLNALINAGTKELNGVDLKKFVTDITLVGDEIGQVMGGGGTGNATSDAKIAQGQAVFGKNENIEAIRTAAEETHSLITNRRHALTKGTYLDQPDTPATGGKSLMERFGLK